MTGYSSKPLATDLVHSESVTLQRFAAHLPTLITTSLIRAGPSWQIADLVFPISWMSQVAQTAQMDQPTAGLRLPVLSSFLPLIFFICLPGASLFLPPTSLLHSGVLQRIFLPMCLRRPFRRLRRYVNGSPQSVQIVNKNFSVNVLMLDLAKVLHSRANVNTHTYPLAHHHPTTGNE